MFTEVWQLVPIAIGVMASPVAVMALIGILLSRDARRNGLVYLLGWILCSANLLALAILVFTLADASGSFHDAWWVPVVHLVVGLVCIGGAVWIHRRAGRLVARVAEENASGSPAVAPRLPGLVRSVERATPLRAFVLGLGIFLSPMNIALVAAAAMEIVAADLPESQVLIVTGGFLAATVVPVAIPVVTLVVGRESAQPMLSSLRSWILHHHGDLTVVILIVVGLLQFVRAIDGWVP